MWEEEELLGTPVFFSLRGCACRRRVFQGQKLFECVCVCCVCIPVPFALKRERERASSVRAPPPLALSLKLNRFRTAIQLFEGLKACLNCRIDPIWLSLIICYLFSWNVVKDNLVDSRQLLIHNCITAVQSIKSQNDAIDFSVGSLRVRFISGLYVYPRWRPLSCRIAATGTVRESVKMVAYFSLVF